MYKNDVHRRFQTLAYGLGMITILIVLQQGNLFAQAVDEPTAVTQKAAAHYFPADALGLVRFGNAAAFRKGWENSSFGAQVDDPALSGFFDSVVSQLDKLKEGLGVDVIELIQSVDEELSLGLIQNSDGKYSVVAVAEFANPATVEQWTGELEKSLSDEGALETTVEIEGTRLRSWKRTSREAVSNLSYFADGRQVVFSDDLQSLAETYRFSSSTEDVRLADNENYQHVMSRIDPGNSQSGVNWYVNPKTMLTTAIASNLGSDDVPPQLQQMIEAVGVNQVRGVGGTFYLGEAGLDSVSTTYGYMETPVQGVLKALTLPATEQRPPTWVKEDVSLYSQMNWSVDRLFDTMREVVDGQQGEGAFDKTFGSLKIAGGKASLSELAEVIDGPLHVAAEVPQSATELFNQKAIFGFGIRDASLIREMIRATAVEQNYETERLGDAELVRVKLDPGASLPGLSQLPPMELAIAVTEDTVLFSPNADYLAATFGEERSQLRPLAESPEYQKVAAQFPQKTSVINFQRQDGRLEGLYNQLRSGLLNTGGMPGLLGLMNFDFEELPPFPAMSKYLQTTGSFIVPEEDGFRIVNIALPPREQ